MFDITLAVWSWSGLILAFFFFLFFCTFALCHYGRVGVWKIYLLDNI